MADPLDGFRTPAEMPLPKECFCVGPQNGQPLCPCKMREKHTRDMLTRLFPMAKRPNGVEHG